MTLVLTVYFITQGITVDFIILDRNEDFITPALIVSLIILALDVDSSRLIEDFMALVLTVDFTTLDLNVDFIIFVLVVFCIILACILKEIIP